MGLARDLLDQAFQLAYSEANKPRQVSLRRAESTAYYGLFHLLTEDAAKRFFPGSPLLLRSRVARTFQHAEMKKVCKQFRQPNLTTALDELLPHGISADLRIVAGTFVEAQEARHRADYDVSGRFLKSTTFLILEKTESAFAVWKRIRKSDEATVFLAALALASRWDR